ncbi:MAG: redoxin domain-containing protein [Bacteroidales bacterium]|nr:redoxin domain-containing protein [Bacteroidales bacterium]MBO5943066.1 redoxin domain-containing protein [Bacteroidales bacterium]
MSRFSKIISFVAAMAALVSCASNARIDGTLTDAASSEVIVKLLESNRYEVLDTVKTDASGYFSYKVDVAEGQPEFVYLFYGEKKIASLLLEAGDKVSVVSDTLGRVTFEGSEESIKLAEVEKAYAAALAEFEDIALLMSAATDQADYDRLAADMSRAYISYYRDRVRYVMENSKSLTVIPVFYQIVGENFPLFSQNTDAILFANIADSLETVYPDSKYVKALRKEAEVRFGYLELQERLVNAEEIGYPEIELPGLDGKMRKLSEMESRVVIVYFWSVAQAQQNMFNIDFFKPLYEEYHSKGLDIYQVSLDVDKTLWATTVRGQELPWTNVCDSRGAQSPYVSVYNLPALPAAFIIADGELVDGKVVDEASLRKLLDDLLK